MDRVLVLEDGKVAEAGPPEQLLADSASAFAQLCMLGVASPPLQTGRMMKPSPQLTSGRVLKGELKTGGRIAGVRLRPASLPAPEGS